jgi:hypothetical protein
MPLSGTFSTMPLADLLQWIGQARRSGTLAVALEFEERYIRFDGGRIAAYGSDDPMARDLGRLCLQRGLLTEPQLFEALDAQSRSHMPLGDVLVSSGLVDADELDGTVRSHIQETVLGLFLWPEGRFMFSDPTGEQRLEVSEWMPPEYELAEPLSTEGILLEGMRRLDEWTRMVEVLPSDSAQVHALAPAADLPILEAIAAHPDPPTLGELLAEHGDSRYSVCEQLFRAFQRGLVAFEAGRERRPQSLVRGTSTVEHLMRAAEALHEEGQHEEAAALLRSAVSMDPFRADVRQLLRKTRDTQLAQLYKALPREGVPRLAVPPKSVVDMTLEPRERKLLTCINGRWDVATLTLTTALGELETLRAMRKLMHAGVLTIT